MGYVLLSAVMFSLGALFGVLFAGHNQDKAARLEAAKDEVNERIMQELAMLEAQVETYFDNVANKVEVKIKEERDQLLDRIGKIWDELWGTRD
jgi:glycyl-tRNA synthetase beta subunit